MSVDARASGTGASAPASGTSASALGRLTQAEGALIVALDAGEVGAIEAAVAEFGRSLDAVRAIGAWRPTPDTERAVRLALQLVDAAAARTNFLADQAQRRLAALTRARGASPRIGYTRTAQGAA